CMRTRSQARRLRQQQRQQQQVPPNLVEPPKDTMAVIRTMADCLQAPLRVMRRNFDAFSFLLEGAAGYGLRRNLFDHSRTWDDLVAKFINQFFPPSKTTNLRNEITNFKQRFESRASEVEDRFQRSSPSLSTSWILGAFTQLDTFLQCL
ncbi:reverse transcriptase domain-containing protein, partial [Tanacetum coccineum]